MPYIGNVLTSFAVETGNITDQAVTTPKLSATGGTEGQVLGLDAGGNLVWTSDPAGQWVTSGNDIFYTTGNVGIGVSSPGQALDVADVDIAPLRVTRDQAVSSGAGLVLRQPDTTDGNDLRIVYQADTTGTGASSDVFFAALEFTAATHDHDTRAGEIGFYTAQGGTGFIERMRINSAGNIGFGNGVDANTKLELSASNAGATQNNILRFTDTDTSFQAGQSPGRIEWNTSDADSAGTTVFLDTFGYTNAVSDLQIGTGAGGSATERMRVRHDGIVLIGTTTTVDSTSKLQIVNDNFPGDIALGRNDTTVSGNALGRILFYGNDDNETYELGAFIVAQADGDHATGDKPTLIAFGTAPDGTASAVERLRINPNGMVELRANQGTAQTNIIRFTDTDTSVAGDQVLGQLQWFSSDISGGGACVKAEIAAVCDDTTPDVRLEIKTHSGSGTDPIESVRITSTGNIQLRRSGTGIDFAASQGAPDAGTSTSEVLDSYEEGTWTPTFSSSGTQPTVTYTAQIGNYTKIGRVVYVSCLITVSAASGGTGTLFVGGLPFTIGETTGTGGSPSFSQYNAPQSSSQDAINAASELINGQTRFFAFLFGYDNAVWVNGSVGGLTNSTSYRVSFCYIAS